MNDIKVGGRLKKLVVGIMSDKTEIKKQHLPSNFDIMTFFDKLPLTS